jgi:cytochrome b involved in lipid metabolism
LYFLAMRKTLIAISLTAALLGPHTPANAHIPVVLLNSDTTAASGPLLVDGTISFAVRAGFTKAGQKKAFRAGFKAGDPVEVQLLIMDKRPENRLKNSQIPSLTITSPSGKSTTLKITERTKFLETFTSTNYFYLARYSAPAEEGIYNFTVTSRTKAAVTIGVGYQEIPGEVIRGAAPTPTVAPTPSASATPAGYTIEQVKANNTATKCWSAIDGKVYDLTNWISSHPGGAGAITSLCGTDGTASFKGQHGGSGQPQSRLSGYLLGPLNK